MSQSNIIDNKSQMASSNVDQGKTQQAGDCDRCIKMDQQYDDHLIISNVQASQICKLIIYQQKNVKNTQREINQKDINAENKVKASERLKLNNEDLKVKIDELSQILQEKLDALKQKKEPQKKEKTVDPVKKELDVLHKRIFMAQKHLKLLEDKQQSNQNVSKITEMKNEIAEKQMLLQKLIKENRLLEDIKIQNEVVLAEREATQEIKDLEDEAIGLRGLLKDVRKDDRKVEKEMTKQCQYLIAIEQKHKEVCEKFGISPTLNQSRFDKLQDLITENHKNRQKKEEKEEKEKKQKLGKTEVNAESYKMLNDEIKKKKQEKQELEGSQKKEFDEISNKIKQINLDRDTLLLRLRDKEKELNIAIMKINELKRFTKHNALQPLGIESTKANKSEMISYMKLKKDYRREQKGVQIGTETAYSWDNSIELPESKDYQIQQVNIWFQDEQIKGIQVEYKLKNGEKVALEGFFPRQTDNLQEKVLKLRGPEYISSISGYQNNFYIEYLRIVTSRGNYILAGTEKNQSRCKKFEFEIKKDEKPISFFGVVDKINYKKNKDSEAQQDEDMVLTSFGIELKKREPNHKPEQMLKQGNGGSQTQLNNQFEDDDNELYTDNTKTITKNSQNRKVVGANISKTSKELNESDLQQYNNYDDVMQNQQSNIKQENSPQNVRKESNQNRNVSQNNSPANVRKQSQPNTPQTQKQEQQNISKEQSPNVQKQKN